MSEFKLLKFPEGDKPTLPWVALRALADDLEREFDGKGATIRLLGLCDIDTGEHTAMRLWANDRMDGLDIAGLLAFAIAMTTQAGPR